MGCSKHNRLLTADQGCKLTQMPMKWDFPVSDTLIDTLLDVLAGIYATVSHSWRKLSQSDLECMVLMWHVHPHGLFLSVYRGGR